jgi:hypothetical protein
MEAAVEEQVVRTLKSTKKKKSSKKGRRADGQQQQKQPDPELLMRKMMKSHGLLLKLLAKNTETQLQTQHQQDAAKSLKASHNITFASTILQISTTIQVIDSKLPGISYLGAITLIMGVVINDTVQACLSEIITTDECDAELWRQVCEYCITEMCSVRGGDTMAHLCREALRPAVFVVNSTPKIYLNAVGHAFSQVRWLSTLLTEDILDVSGTATIIDKHLDVWPSTMYQSLQTAVTASMDFEKFVTASTTSRLWRPCS